MISDWIFLGVGQTKHDIWRHHLQLWKIRTGLTIICHLHHLQYAMQSRYQSWRSLLVEVWNVSRCTNSSAVRLFTACLTSYDHDEYTHISVFPLPLPSHTVTVGYNMTWLKPEALQWQSFPCVMLHVCHLLLYRDVFIYWHRALFLLCCSATRAGLSWAHRENGPELPLHV